MRMIVMAVLAALSTPAAATGTSAADAAATIRGYYSALNRGDFRAAYQAWDHSGRASGKSYGQFRGGFAQTARTTVTTGRPGSPEGAAGSLYIEVPVEVYARLKNGRPQHFTGAYTLRRVNDVPGSSAASRGWHLYSAKLRAPR